MFRNIRRIEGIEDREISAAFNMHDMVMEFKNVYGNKGGGSGSFFLHSVDRRFMLKTISKGELKVILRNFLKEYHCHLEKYENSLLARILGVYSFELQGSYSVKLILMQSIYNPTEVQSIYDLKGSKLDRQVLFNSNLMPPQLSLVQEVYKDIDFLANQQFLFMQKASADILLAVIERDVRLLRRFKLMDYSLLVVVKAKGEMTKYFYKSSRDREEGYAIGIIDFLQEYNRSKKCETITKKILTLKPRLHISSVNPEDYMVRFINFIAEIVAPNESQGKSFISLGHSKSINLI